MAGVKGRTGYRFVPTDDHRHQVSMMLGCGLNHEQVALVLNISRNTLEKHFRAELAVGDTKHNALVAQSLFQAATVDKNVTAMIFWLKTRMGWRETNVFERTGDAQIVEVIHRIVVGQTAQLGNHNGSGIPAITFADALQGSVRGTG